jgi:hypothetical protein
MSSLESHSLGHSDKDKGRDCLQHYESFYAISIRCVEQYCSLHQFCVCTAPASSSLFADETTYILESEFGRTTNGVHKYAQTTHTHKNCSLCFNNNIPHAQTRKKNIALTNTRAFKVRIVFHRPKSQSTVNQPIKQRRGMQNQRRVLRLPAKTNAFFFSNNFCRP